MNRTVILTLLVLFLVMGTMFTSSPAHANEPPVTHMLDTSDAPYRSDFCWSGTDPDGEIAYFEYAVSPPDEFTASEIADPEHSPGLTVTIRPGPSYDRDTVRVEKDTGSGIVSFDYVRTPLRCEDFVFPTDPDPSTTAYFTRVHTLHVRARDDEGAYGTPVSDSFLVFNRTPTSSITSPSIGSQPVTVGSWLSVSWTGYDPDGVTLNPASYRYKLVRLDTLDPPVAASPPPDYGNVLDVLVADQPWQETDAGGVVITDLVYGGSYLFGLRAVDDGGAYQPVLHSGNAFTMIPDESVDFPRIRLTEPQGGDFLFEDPDQAASTWLRAGNPATFRVECLPRGGSPCGDVRWSIDPVDPDGEDDWSPWTPAAEGGVPVPPFSFPDSGVHDLYVEARSIQGQTLRGRLTLHIALMTFERDLLVVDDVRDQTWPRDSEHDAFWAAMVAGYPGPHGLPSDRWDVFGLDDVATVPVTPSLEEMGRYRAVLWDVNGGGYAGRCGLTDVVADGSLQVYLRLGGALWVCGQYTGGAMTPTTQGTAWLQYPIEIAESGFANRCMRLLCDFLYDDRGARSDLHGMVGVQPWLSGPLPGLELDVLKQNPGLRGTYGIPYCDLVFDPILETSDPFFRGRIDSLYAFTAIGPTKNPPRGSVYDGKLCGIRWEDPDPNPRQGRTIWFGFPMYYFRNDQAQDVFSACVNWLLDAPVAVVLTHLGVERVPEGARLSWAVADGSGPVGFHVHREAVGEGRVRLTGNVLQGERDFAFLDPNPPDGPADYWVEEIDRSGGVSWHGPARLEAARVHPGVRLFPPVPNPALGSTVIRYELPEPGNLSLRIFDLSGRLVRELESGTRAAGVRETPWDGRNDSGTVVGAGLYLIELRSESVSRTRKLLVLDR